MRVTLGGFEFRDLEKPDFVQFGGKQSLAIREFPGGNLSIQDLGATYRPVTWRGVFSGADAYDRMMTVGLMRTAGKPVDLVTDKFTMPVMIEEFLPDYKNDRRIPFAITLRRLVDNRPGQTQKTDLVDLAADQVAVGSSEQTYTVQDGDTLSRIAANIIGDPNAWESIYLDNQDILVDGPHLIQPGMKLVISSA